MLAKRIIPCLDIREGQTVKGINFVGLRQVGDPVELGAKYAAEGADELVYLDISASEEGRRTFTELVARIAARIDIPFTVGGGISSVDDASRLLDAGADKITLNSAAVANPALIDAIAARYGSQFVVAAIDARTVDGRWVVTTHGGRRPTQRELFAWAAEAADRGAGEILFTSMDHDGTKNGYPCDTFARLAELPVPIIASGGAGTADHIADVLTLMRQTGFSRMPVYKDDPDDIAGIAHIKDLIGLALDGKGDEPVREHLRDATFVPDTKDILPLLSEMQTAHDQIVVVVDEYGGTAGIITVEDIVEEIVGEIEDEFDPDNKYLTRLSRREWLVDGRFSCDDAEELGWPIEESDDYETVAGWILDLCDSVPDIGEVFEVDGYKFKVQSMRGQRISLIRVIAPAPEPKPEELQDEEKDKRADKKGAAKGDKPEKASTPIKYVLRSKQDKHEDE